MLTYQRSKYVPLITIVYFQTSNICETGKQFDGKRRDFVAQNIPNGISEETSGRDNFKWKMRKDRNLWKIMYTRITPF